MNSKPDIAIETTADYSKFAGFVKLTKPRLSLLVVFSAVVSYITVYHEADWKIILALSLGGFLVTGAANAYNQVIEKNLDKLMKRTMNRPLPTETLNHSEAVIFATVCAVLGCFLIFQFTNILAGILSISSIVLYAMVYTPMKRMTPFSVFIGAIPGALPTLIGAIAGEQNWGTIGPFALFLYAIQFFWQFPHFWAIAWVSHDDYQKAGFFMLPSLGGRDHSSRFQILIYTLFLIPISVLPSVFEFTGIITAAIILVLDCFFFFQAYRLYKTGSIESARKLMFGSFIYLPVVQLALMAGY